MNNQAYDRLFTLITEAESDEELATQAAKDDAKKAPEDKELVSKVAAELIKAIQQNKSSEPSTQASVSLFKTLPQFRNAQIYGGTTVMGKLLDKARKAAGLDRKTIVRSAFG